MIEHYDKSFSKDDLLLLINGSIDAIILKSFLPTALAMDYKNNILCSDKIGVLQHAVEFERIGYAYSEIKSESQRSLYHNSVKDNSLALSQLFKNNNHPIENFLSILRNTWKEGIELLEVDSKKCFFGICRIMRPEVDLKPHTDRLERNLPKNVKNNISLNAQLSVNVYIYVPESGGETEFWDLEPTENEYKELMQGRHYGIDRELLPKADNAYKPMSGDLLILNSRRIHAVRPTLHDSRITTSCFIGYQSPKLPLVYWS